MEADIWSMLPDPKRAKNGFEGTIGELVMPAEEGRRIRTCGETVGFLVEGLEKTLTRGRNRGAVKIVPKPGGSLLYTLRTITRHRTDRGILPTEPAISAAAAKAVAGFVESFG